MNVTATEYCVLRLIASGACFGLDIVKRSNGDLKMGSVYVLLKRLEDKGLVESQRESLSADALRPPRRLYKLTLSGKKIQLAFAAWAHELSLVRASQITPFPALKPKP